MLRIRQEKPADYEAVETLVRQAFYNMYMPGCVEHYLVHIMRDHEDFVPALALVAEEAGEIVGQIMFTKATLTADDGTEMPALTLGPIAVAPARQRCGIGKTLIARAVELAQALGYVAIVLFGSPANYVANGFVSCKHYKMTPPAGRYPAAMMVRELVPGALAGHTWIYRDSPVMAVSEEAAARYDAMLPPMEKHWQPSQEEFYILSQAFLD